MKIQDLMTRNPKFVTPETPVREAARLMKDEDVGIVPVVDNERSLHLVGVITDRDIALRIVAEGRSADTVVRDVMSAEALATCPPNADIDDAMDKMAAEQVRRIPIVDERGSLVGVVSQADVVRKANNEKAERTVERISEPGGSHSG
jgi:CBS domain-containing protein